MGLNIGAGGATGANYVEAATFRPKYEYSSGNLLSGDNSIYLQNDYNIFLYKVVLYHPVLKYQIPFLRVFFPNILRFYFLS